MSPYATHQQLQDRWRTLNQAEQAKASILLADASRMINRLYPGTPARLAADPTFVDDLQMIVCNMVKRTMRREAGDTDGLEELTDQRGPYRITRRFATPNGELDFTAREEEILAGAPAATGGALPLWGC